MKRMGLLILMLALFSFLAFSQLRIDAGLAVPIGIGTVLDGSVLEMDNSVSDFLSRTFLPLPEGAMYYQFDFGKLKLAIGARAFTMVIETIIWPNALAELVFGPVVVEAQVGGGAFLLLGLVSDFVTGRVFFPDLSVWLKVGTRQAVRFGAGVIGMFLPEQNSTFPIVIYLSGKITLASG
jgi:hypothetical protein